MTSPILDNLWTGLQCFGPIFAWILIEILKILSRLTKSLYVNPAHTWYSLHCNGLSHLDAIIDTNVKNVIESDILVAKDSEGIAVTNIVNSWYAPLQCLLKTQ